MKTPRPSDAELIKALKQAYYRINAGNSVQYICCNLPDNEAGVYIADFIQKAMGDVATLGIWVRRNVLFSVDFPSDKDMRKYRLRWIQHMIDQLESK